MSFTSELEKKITDRVGFSPCITEESSFYYEVTGVRNSGCCLFVDVNLYIKSCLDDLFGQVCNLKTNIEWSLAKDPDNAHQYIATLSMSSLEISCGCNTTNTIDTIEITIN